MGAYNKAFGTGKHYLTITNDQLTAPGETTEQYVYGLHMHTYQVKVASIDTNVIVRVEGSLDGTNWFVVPVESVTVTGASFNNQQATLTANGTYILQLENVVAPLLRFDWVSEAGGTAATVDVVEYHSN